jgi:hypothetical protein
MKTFSMKHQFAAFFFLISGYTSFAQERYLEVTSGGGITGAVSGYKIRQDGFVLKGKGLREIIYSSEGKLKRCSVKKYFKNAKSLLNAYPDFNHPGNLYFSIVVLDQGKKNQITWGNDTYGIPEGAEKLYEKINKAVARLTFAPHMSLH